MSAEDPARPRGEALAVSGRECAGESISFSPQSFSQSAALAQRCVLDIVKVVLQLHTRLKSGENRSTMI